MILTDSRESWCPGSLEYDAAREIAANMGTSMNSSINISTDAGAQIASVWEKV